jgi:hypothetical protein
MALFRARIAKAAFDRRLRHAGLARSVLTKSVAARKLSDRWE